MDSSRRKRAQDLFRRAIELSGAERPGFLKQQCPDDPEVLAEVESLLEHHATEFLERPDHLTELGRDRLDSEHPLQIGDYKILSVLGSGGMGVVYLAEQERPVRRRVAVKLVKRGMDTAQVVARFETERQALALMNHPNIARVLDAGATEQGRPYFVMEFVKGVPISDHCDRFRLSGRERLELFVDVCEGVQHAHQKGIIHRDIKATNVLVSIEEEKVVPKIIDFGVAKAIDHRLTERTLYTELGQIIGTPEYMSPEQAELTGQDIDTRTDVYSLGVLLYELLVGAYPFGSEEKTDAGLDEIRRRIREDEPHKPSTRLTNMGKASADIAKRRRTDPAAFARELRGDLDWITMKALEKDRTRRYASAIGLADDVRRYLGNEPVLAGPPSTLYRIRKFVRRHRVGVAAASVVVAALLVGSVGTTVGLMRAMQSEKEAETAYDFMAGLFTDADPREGGAGRDITARELLDKAAARIEEELRDQPRVRARMMAVIGRSYYGIGLFKQARPMLEKAVADQRGLSEQDRLALAGSLNELANLSNLENDYGQAQKLYQESLAIYEELLGPDDLKVATAVKNLGGVLAKWEKYEEAIAYHERAIRIRERHYGSDHIEVGYSLGGLGEVYSRMGRHDKAIPLLERSLEIREKKLEPGHMRLGLGLYSLAVALEKAGNADRAMLLYRRALDVWDRTLDPNHAHIRECVFNLAQGLKSRGEYDEAHGFYERALQIDEASFGPDHEYVAETLEAFAVSLRESGRLEEATAAQDRADRIRGE